MRRRLHNVPSTWEKAELVAEVERLWKQAARDAQERRRLRVAISKSYGDDILERMQALSDLIEKLTDQLESAQAEAKAAYHAAHIAQHQKLQ